MEITRFEDLLTASHAQAQPQRLLFVFATTLSGRLGAVPTTRWSA